MVSAVMRELNQWGLELRAWKVHEVWVHLLRHDEKNRQIAQTWRTFPANHSDMARKSGSLKGWARTRFKPRLKSAKILYFGHRFFDEIRQIHRIFDAFRQTLQILCRNQARSKSGAKQIRREANQTWSKSGVKQIRREPNKWRETRLAEVQQSTSS